MSAQRDMDQSTSKVTTPAEWLMPAEALSRFSPPAGMSFGASRKVEEQVRYGFRVGDLGLLINPNTGSEAMPMPTVFPIPNTPVWLSGMINLRGNLVPIFDLAVLFAMPRKNDSQTFTLVLDKGANAVGMIVDTLPRALTEMRRMNNKPPMPATLEKYAGTSYDTAFGVWVEFDHEAFFQSLASPV